jgi:F0F1-type ATP synthase assembly protein I
MERAAYIILLIVTIGWLVAMLVGMITAFPIGLIGLVVIVGLGLLFIKALKERLSSSKTDRYSKEVEK